jgi:uncharacterized membrane protein
LNTKTIPIYYLLLSAFSLGLLVLIVFFFTSKQEVSLSEKLVTAIAFCGSCLLGISVTLRPNWVRRLFSQHFVQQKSRANKHPEITFLGHHPLCPPFRSHVISIGKKTLCAGCLGLALGAGGSLVFFLIYLFAELPPLLTSQQMFLVGIFLVIFGLIVGKITKHRPSGHVVFNIGFIAGFLFITLGILELTARPSFAILAVLFSWLWIATKKELSIWNHHTICQSCSRTCKMY